MGGWLSGGRWVGVGGPDVSLCARKDCQYPHPHLHPPTHIISPNPSLSPSYPLTSPSYFPPVSLTFISVTSFSSSSSLFPYLYPAFLLLTSLSFYLLFFSPSSTSFPYSFPTVNLIIKRLNKLRTTHLWVTCKLRSGLEPVTNWEMSQLKPANQGHYKEEDIQTGGREDGGKEGR